MKSINGKCFGVKWIDKKKEFVIMITLLEYISIYGAMAKW